MTAFFINMVHDTDRLSHMQRQLAGLPYEVVRSHGLTSDEWRQYGLKGFSPARSFIANRRKMRRGQIGCAYSHLWVYHQILERDLPYALVLEDDVALDGRFRRCVENAVKSASPDVPQVFLFSAVDGDPGDGRTEEIRRIRRAWGADAYLITRAGARLLIAKNEPVLVVIDTFKRFVRYFGLELYRVYPISARQKDDVFSSDVPLAPKPPGWVRGTLALVDWVLIMITGR